MSDSPPAAATLVQTIPPALFLLVPLFTLALALLALSHKPQAQAPQPHTPAKRQARIAYTLIGALAVLSTLAGALPLSHASNAQAEALIQALLSLLLGIPVLHLPASYVRPRTPQLITRIAHTGLLAISLSSATLLGLLAPFLPHSSSAVPLYLPSALFLAYTLVALPRIATTLFLFLHFSPQPITIHVATHHTSIPLSLPSPASSSASFPFSATEDHHAEIALPDQHQQRTHRHEKLNSVDSSTSTITAVDHTRSLTSPTPPLLATHTAPPSSDLEHQHQESPLHSNDYPGGTQNVLRAQLIYSRSRSLLVFLFVAQLTILAACACALGANIPASSTSSSVSLRIVQAACTVLAVTGTMSAYLLHAYNTHLSSPSRPHSQHININPTFNSTSSTANITARAHTNGTSNNDANLNISPSTRANTTQMLEVDNTNARQRPVLIQLAPPPPPRSRKRVDAGVSMPMSMPRGKSGAFACGGGGKGGGYGYAYGSDLESIKAPVSAPGLIPPAAAAVAVVPAATSPTNASPNGVGEGRRFGRPERASTTANAKGNISMNISREPVIVTYEPPPNPNPNEKSIFETTDTEAEAEEGGRKSGARSLFSSLSLSSLTPSIVRSKSSGGLRRAASTLAQTQVKRASTNANDSNCEKPKQKLKLKMKQQHTEVDPAAMYICKRGSLPAPPKRLFGWEFGWDASPSPAQSAGSGVVGRGKGVMESQQDSSFLDMSMGGDDQNGHGHGSSLVFGGLSLGLGIGGGDDAREAREARKLKRNTVGHCTRMPEDGLGSMPMPMRMRTMPMPMPMTKTRTMPLPMPMSMSMPNGNEKDFNNDDVNFDIIVARGPSSRRLRKRAGSRPGTADSAVSGASVSSGGGGLGGGVNEMNAMNSIGATSKCGRLHLKRSFQRGVGRTLGPGLSLAAASGMKASPGEKERQRNGDEDLYEDVDEEEEGEMRYIAAAGLVSASFARATPAAKMPMKPMPAPPLTLTPLPPPPPYASHHHHHQGRSTIPLLVTSSPASANNAYPSSSPVMSPASAKSVWKTHPFADVDRVESPAVYGYETHAGDAADVDAEVEDDVVQLEREMEEMRGRIGGMKGLGAREGSGTVTPTPTPTLIVTQTPTPGPTPEKVKANKTPNALRKRTSASSSLVQKSEWVPVSSSSSPNLAPPSLTTGFPYRFPMIFPGSIGSSSSLSAPPSQSQFLHPHSSPQPQPQSAPNTPRGPSTLRQTAMGSVRSAFAGVGARMSGATARMSVNSGAGGSTRSGNLGGGGGGDGAGGYALGQMIMEDHDGDFMDLRDPFASPPPSKMKRKGDSFFAAAVDASSVHEDVFGGLGGSMASAGAAGVVAGVGRSLRMSAWGRLPMPVRSFSSPPGSVGSARKSAGGAVGKSHSSGERRKHKQEKEKTTRKKTLPGGGGGGASRAGEEDVDFDIEEALLAQRLLRRLDADGWESRA